MFVSLRGVGNTYLHIYRFLFEVFQFLNVGNAFLKKKPKNHIAGAKSNMASGDNSALPAKPCLFTPALCFLHTERKRETLAQRPPV